VSRFIVALVVASLANIASAESVEVSFKAADGVQVFGDVYASPRGEREPVILLFHQAGSDARGEYTVIAERLQKNGYNVVAIDQRSGGDRFGGVNRTMAGLEDKEIGYCEAYPDLVAALTFAREHGFYGRLAVWGSSYSAGLVFKLAAENSEQVNAVLGFSPASGGPMADCSPSDYLDKVKAPVLALRPKREMEIDSVRKQKADFEMAGMQTYVADPGVHGSSMLNPVRVAASTEATWAVVLEFLDANLRGDNPL
jgi:dienelactone hydrolase